MRNRLIMMLLLIQVIPLYVVVALKIGNDPWVILPIFSVLPNILFLVWNFINLWDEAKDADENEETLRRRHE